MKSLFIVLNVFVMFAPAQAQDLTENPYTIVFDGRTYHFTTVIRGKQFYKLTLGTSTHKDSIEVYGDLNLQQIRLLFETAYSNRISSDLEKLQEEAANLDSVLSELDTKSRARNASLENHRFDTSGNKISSAMREDIIRMEKNMSRLKKDSIFFQQKIAELTVKQQNKNHFPDSICLAAYSNASLFIGNFFNEKTAENWGMTNAQFAEMETMEVSLKEKNDKIDELHLLKKAEKKLCRIKDAKGDTVSAKNERDSIVNSYELNIIEAENNRNLTGKTLQKFKRQNIKPSVYLSGSAFAYLNKSVNNDSMRSNILAVGLYAEKGDLSSVDMQITFGQSEDIISGNNRDVFGSSILIPGIRSLSFLSNFNQNSLFPNSRGRFWRHMGYGVSFNVSQVQWRWTNTDSMSINNGNSVRVVPVATDAYLSYNWLRTQKSRVNQEAKTDIYTDFGLASRWIWGNASQSDQILKYFTGSDRAFYLGFLFGCKIKVDRLTIFYHGVLFPTGMYGGVPGLTGGQIVSSLGFRADIVKFK